MVSDLPRDVPPDAMQVEAWSVDALKNLEGGFDYNVVVVGSGFGGSVTALRLSEKGYRVGVLEAGRRWEAEDFPKSNWKSRDFLWMPKLGMRGIQRVSLLKDVCILSGAGVGG